MGSINSGRRKGAPGVKPLIEEALSICCRNLKKRGLLFSGKTFDIDFIVDSKTVLILHIQAHSDSLCLQYNSTGSIHIQTVTILRKPCHFGGTRPYFICPKCLAKRTALYLGKTGHFACRVCHRYGYRAQRLSAHQRHENRALILKKKLAAADQACHSIKRPKGMWTKNFEKVKYQISRHEISSGELFIQYFNGIIKKYDSWINNGHGC